MEKYAKLMKGLEMCAGPDCCKDGCPYYGETVGGTTCRARLLMDANIAIMNERANAVAALQDRDAAEKENDVLRERCREKDKLCKEREGLKEYALALEKEGQEARADRDKLKQEITCYIQQRERAEADLHAVREQNKALIEARDALVRKASDMNSQNDELRKECDMLTTRCTVLQNEINALVLKMGGKHDGKTDRPSVGSDDLAEKCETYRAEANYWTGRAEGLLEVIKTLFWAEEAPADE